MKLIRFKSNTLIINRILYGLLSLKGDSYSIVADQLDISSESLNRYVIKGALPSEENKERLVKFFGIPEDILFDKEDINRRKEIAKNNPEALKPWEDDYEYPEGGEGWGIGVRKPRFRVPTNGLVKRPVLYAMLLADNIKVSDFAKEIGVSRRTAYTYIAKEVSPSLDVVENILNLLSYDLMDNLLYTIEFEVR